MPTTKKQRDEFHGRHWETGTLHNTLARRGVPAPHTGQPYSEALLLGVSGGITFGYFTFEYKGYLPHLALLTRNTFDPMETIYDRLAIPREVRQTTDAKTGQANLLAALDAGHPAIVFADMFSLPYNDLPFDARNWGMTSVLVYGHDGDTFFVADRSRRPIPLSAAELQKARGRVKQDRFRLITLESPDPTRLASAVQKGIWGCISLFTEAPPKGARDNFGFAAYQKWAKMLVNQRNKQSWERVFPAGEKLYHALAGSPVQPGGVHWIKTWVSAPGADRGLYADFLDEAAVILNKPGLKEAGSQFRQSGAAWNALADAMLPDEIALFGEARRLIVGKHQQFIERGAEALPDIQQAHKRLREIHAAVKKDFPLSPGETVTFREGLRDRVLEIHDLELQAVETMQAIMA